MNIQRTCTKCGTQLLVTNVTEGGGTNGYVIGCIPCKLTDSGGTLYSSSPPRAGNANTTVQSL